MNKAEDATSTNRCQRGAEGNIEQSPSACYY